MENNEHALINKCKNKLDYLVKNWQEDIVIVPTTRSQWKKKRKQHLYMGMLHEEARLRDVLRNEIVIEFDHVNNGTGKKMIAAVKRNLSRDRITHEVYDHEGKSPHIHVLVKGLEKLTPEHRKHYKKSFIDKYVPLAYKTYVDTTLCGEHLVALEYRPHFKHKTPKLLVSGYDGKVNTLKKEFMPSTIPTVYPSQIHMGMFDIKKDRFFNYALNNQLKQGFRNNILFKNVAIAMNNTGMTEKQKIKIARKIGENCLDRSTEGVVREILAWCGWAKQNNAMNYNTMELEKFMKKQR